MNIRPLKSTFPLLSFLALSFVAALAQAALDLVDVRQYGARAVNAWRQYGTTATGEAGSNQVTTASATIFRKGTGS